MPQPITPARALLEAQRATLTTAILEAQATGAFVSTDARKLLSRIVYALTETDLALEVLAGSYGQNGWAPAVADHIASLRWHTDDAIARLAKVDARAAKRVVAAEMARAA